MHEVELEGTVMFFEFHGSVKMFIEPSFFPSWGYIKNLQVPLGHTNTIPPVSRLSAQKYEAKDFD